MGDPLDFDLDTAAQVNPRLEDQIICWYEGPEIETTDAEFAALIEERRRAGHVLSREEVLAVIGRAR